jgi:uncharacterized OB-fold protein
MSFPLPEPTPLSQPYWDALRQGRLTFQRCRHCSHAWLPPRAECPHCLEAEWDWTTASGKGRVVSWVVYHHAYHEAFRDRLPYNVALVELDEGPRLITNIINPDHGGGIKAERAVQLHIEDEHGVALAKFTLI